MAIFWGGGGLGSGEHHLNLTFLLFLYQINLQRVICE